MPSHQRALPVGAKLDDNLQSFGDELKGSEKRVYGQYNRRLMPRSRQSEKWSRVKVSNKDVGMKMTITGIAVSIIALCALSLTDSALADKGGLGKGGGYSEDGVLYHSHSDRSYSGKDDFKGQGKAKGKFKAKGGQKKSKKASQGDIQEDSQAQ